MTIKTTWFGAAGVLLFLTITSITSAQEGLNPYFRQDSSWQLNPIMATAKAYKLDSKILSEKRRIFVALPPTHWRTTRPYPVLVVLDGESNFGPVATQATVLAQAGHMPEAIVVGIENTDRLRDLSPPGLPVSGNDGKGRADLFLRFLNEELRPALSKIFRAGGPVSLVGHSSGGLFVHYAAAEKPETFASILALDSPMHLNQGQPAKMVIDAASNTAQDLNLVSMEAKFGWSPEMWNALVESAPKSWTLAREPVTEETHGSMIWPASYHGLKRLFAFYGTLAQGQTSPIERLRDFDKISSAIESMPPPESLLRDVVEDYIEARKLDLAQETLARLVEGYGESLSTEELGKKIQAADKDSLEGPPLDELLAADFPSMDAVAALVGSWEGYSVMDGATMRSPLGLSIRSEAGRPVGKFTMAQGPGHEVEYMAVVGDEFHLGYMNRMRPRGMLMYEGTVKDDVFSGQFVLRGVVFRLPDGREIPKMSFYLRRTEN